MIARTDGPARVKPNEWEELGEFLRRELILFGESSRTHLLSVWEDIRRAERGLDDVLVIGLVGGTGVGKSTLINAIAGAAISTSGDRRPTTDRVIVYRHERTLVPAPLPQEDIAEPQRIHTSAPLERVLVLDFPDFDSVERTHHEVLQRFFPHLDVLIVLVDDVKYGDARLFDLLGRLPQSHENLHVVLNKIDSLRMRYPGEWEDVSRNILVDLRGKLRRYAGIDLPEERFLPLSALVAFRRQTENAEADGGEGAFEELVRVLEAYQAERRRRAAKELNIEARQEALLGEVYRASGVDRHAARVERAALLIEDRRRDLRRSIAVLSSAVLTAEERRALAAERLERSAQAFGFPIDFLLTLKSQLPWRRRRRRSRRTQGGLSTGRLKRHFRAYLDAVQNSLQDLWLEVGDAIPRRGERRRDPRRAAGASMEAGRPRREREAAGGGEELFLAPVRELGRRLTEWETKFEKRWAIWNHLLPALVVCGVFLSVTHPALEAGVEQWAADGQIAWGQMGRELLLSFVGALSPAFLLSAAILIVLAYGLTAVVAWTRQIQRLERVFRRAEEDAAAAARDHGERRLQEFEDQTGAWLRERAELERLVGEVGRSGDVDSPNRRDAEDAETRREEKDRIRL